MQPTNSRAIATTTWLAGFPRASSVRYRLQSLTWVFQLKSWTALGCVSSLRGRCRLTCAGERYAQRQRGVVGVESPEVFSAFVSNFCPRSADHWGYAEGEASIIINRLQRTALRTAAEAGV